MESSAQLNASALILLQVLLEAEALATDMPLHEIARRGQELLEPSPELLEFVQKTSDRVEPAATSSTDSVTFWRDQACAAWTRGRGWFELDGDVLGVSCPALSQAKWPV